jgi:hypothetical protein
MAKYPNAVIRRSDLKGLEVAPSVGGNLFGAIKGEELLLGLSSHALTQVTVHTLCSIIRIARREGVFRHLQAKITSLLGGKGSSSDGDASAKAKLTKILVHSPSINRKCHVSRLVFLARLSAVYRMETNYLSEDGEHFFIPFDDGLKNAVTTSLNLLIKFINEELKVDDKSKKRKTEVNTSDIEE